MAVLHVLLERVAMEKYLDCYLFARPKTDDPVRHSCDSTLLLTKLAKFFFTQWNDGQEVTLKTVRELKNFFWLKER